MTEGILSVGLLGFGNATGAVIRFMQRFRFIVYPNAGFLTLEKMNEVATGTPGTAIIDGPGRNCNGLAAQYRSHRP
jgi:hypothetical protein